MLLNTIVLATSLCGTVVPRCTCVIGHAHETPTTSAAYLQPFDAVFEGDVVGWATEVRSYPVDSTRTLSYYEAVVKIAIRRQWKGTPSDTVVIRTALEGAMCGFHFERTGRYLVFATADPVIGLGTTSCSPTRAWVNGAERIVELLGPPVRRR
jgi:hypothetical protein